MMNDERIACLREDVCRANLEINDKGLVVAAFGNVSGIDRESGIVAIKPSGVSYEDLTPETMVLVDLEYRVVEGTLRPSSDTKTHVMLYRAFPEIGGVVHTHSKLATAWAQACRPIPCYGTTHADYFHGAVPCTAILSDEQIAKDYEEQTAVQIVEAFAALDYRTMPAVLVAAHGPFTWGTDPSKAVFHSYVLEYVAELALLSRSVSHHVLPIKHSLLDKHFSRKHGAGAYYGQGGADARAAGRSQ